MRYSFCADPHCIRQAKSALFVCVSGTTERGCFVIQRGACSTKRGRRARASLRAARCTARSGGGWSHAGGRGAFMVRPPPAHEPKIYTADILAHVYEAPRNGAKT